MMIVILKEKIRFKNFFFEINLKKKNCWGGKKTATKKVRFPENLSKIFPKAGEIFDNQRIDDSLPEITISNKQYLKN